MYTVFLRHGVVHLLLRVPCYTVMLQVDTLTVVTEWMNKVCLYVRVCTRNCESL